MNKKLLNERILGLAGIVSMPSFGFSSNSPPMTNENKSTMDYISSHTNDEEFYEFLNDPSNSVIKIEDITGYYLVVDDSDVVAEYVMEYVIPDIEAKGEWVWDNKIGHRGGLRRIASPSQTADSSNADASLNEQTRRETIGMIKHASKFNPHKKGLINERFFGIVGLKPVGGLVGVPTSNSFQNSVNEVSSDLSRLQLYQTLPNLHSNVLMELADRLNQRPSGRNWGDIVERLADEYMTNPSAKKYITEKLKIAGLI